MTDYSQVNRAHGFVWPRDLPNCVMCDRPANDPLHINPMAATRGLGLPINLYSEVATDTNPDKRHGMLPSRSHPYQSRSATAMRNIQCVRCGQPLNSALHAPGMIAGAGYEPQRAFVPPHASEVVPGYDTCATCGLPAEDTVHDGVQHAVVMPEMHVVDGELPTNEAFVMERAGVLTFASRAATITRPDGLPNELARTWTETAAKNPRNIWVAGRFVQADRPNRNMAYWSTEDLEVGEPTVAHGPLNWLHDITHVIGAITDATLVRPDTETAAAIGFGNHISALAVVWPYVDPRAAMAVQRASAEGQLWYSMECRSREVACLEPGCDHVQSYKEYMLSKGQRCPHVVAGGPRRFVDPFFMGGAIIVPPMRPGWADSNAKVLESAAPFVERQAAAFEGMSATQAETIVAALMSDGGTLDV